MRMNVAAIRDHTGREREDASFTPHQRDGRRLLSSHRSPFHLLRSGFRRHMIQTSLAADRKGVMRYPWLAAVAFLLSADIADAMTYKDIAGQWCGETTDYVFAPNSLSVKFHDSRPAETFKITKTPTTTTACVLIGSTLLAKVRSRFSVNSSATPPWCSSRMTAPPIFQAPLSSIFVAPFSL